MTGIDPARFRELIAEHISPEPSDPVTDGARLCADLGADSLDQIEVSLAIEDEFDVAIDDAKLAEMFAVADVTVGQLREAIEGGRLAP